MIACRNARDISAMRDLGRLTAEILELVVQSVRPGMSTKDIEDLAVSLMRERDVKPAFLGLYGFPGAMCISVNEELLHGIPSSDKIVREHDLVSIDFGLKRGGWYSDMTRSFSVGTPGELAARLLEVGLSALQEALRVVKPGATVGDLGHAVQSFVEGNGFCVVRKFVGHGVGREPHEEPEIPNFGKPGHGPVFKPGMTLAIEPMITVDDPDVEVLSDGWTVVSADRKLCVHFEDTIVVTEDGYEILTAK
jgi:methionyl aminopeptidase